MLDMMLSVVCSGVMTRDYSWHYEEVKEDTFQKGLPVSNKAAVQDQVLKKHVEGLDLNTVKDFLHCHAATSKGR